MRFYCINKEINLNCRTSTPLCVGFGFHDHRAYTTPPDNTLLGLLAHEVIHIDEEYFLRSKVNLALEVGDEFICSVGRFRSTGLDQQHNEDE
jgi:hypothetical protein